jgi:hypothetical protein
MQNALIPFFPLSTLSQIGNSQLYKMGFYIFFLPFTAQLSPLSLRSHKDATLIVVRSEIM